MPHHPRCARLLIWCPAILLAAAFLSAAGADETETRSPARIDLDNWWAHYQQSFITAGGRVMRPEHGGDTVSEAQAYALLYGSLLDDRTTFDRVWEWTRTNLARKEKFDDNLFAWRWQDGQVADWNSASDASLDIALALLLGFQKWNDASLRDAALAIAGDVLKKETVHTKLGLTLLPGTWGRNDNGDTVINPSYFSPATFRMLYELTHAEQWLELTELSYTVWEKTGWRVARARGAGLPPDWCRITPEGDFAHAKGRSTACGWDALRVPVRAGLDALLMEHKGARRYLAKHQVRFFRKKLEGDADRTVAVYAYWGAQADPSESLAMSASALFAFQAAGEEPPPSLTRTFDAQRKHKAFTNNYYAQSLAFFPLAFRAGILGGTEEK